MARQPIDDEVEFIEEIEVPSDLVVVIVKFGPRAISARVDLSEALRIHECFLTGRRIVLKTPAGLSALNLATADSVELDAADKLTMDRLLFKATAIKDTDGKNWPLVQTNEKKR